MHHRTDADGPNLGQRQLICSTHMLAQITITLTQPLMNVFQMVGPNTLFKGIFPAVTPLGQYLTVLIDQYCFDTRRSKLNSQSRLPL